MFHVVWDAPRALVSARVRGAFFFLSCNFSHCFGGFLIQSLYLSKKKKKKNYWRHVNLFWGYLNFG